MDLEPALKRIGASIVKKHIAETELTIYMRVDPKQGAKWVDLVTAFLLGARERTYRVDLSKYFYVDQGNVKYLWRLRVTGEASPGALVLLAQCALETSMAYAPRIDSFPLVGRVEYPYNPAKGLIKGAHDIDEANVIVSTAITGGVAPGLPS